LISFASGSFDGTIVEDGRSRVGAFVDLGSMVRCCISEMSCVNRRKQQLYFPFLENRMTRYSYRSYASQFNLWYLE